MIPLFTQAGPPPLNRGDDAESRPRGPQIFLRVNNDEARAFGCTLHGITGGHFHLTSDYYFNEGLNVSISFGSVEIPGVVLSSAREEQVTSLCVAATGAQSRTDPRFPINQPGRMIAVRGGEPAQIPCQLVDISRTGMGLRLSTEVDVGETAYVETETSLVIGTIRHCLESDKPGEFQAGLQIIDIVPGLRQRSSGRGLGARLGKLMGRHASGETQLSET